MLTDEKILVTGPAGQIARPLAEYLARDNEVWGVARFGDADSRAEIEHLGIRTVVADLGSGDLDDLPTDFTYVLHLAAYREHGDDFAAALRVNAEGTGFVMRHCRQAKAILVMSTHAVYRPTEDPFHPSAEGDPLGDANPPYARTYSISKLAQESVATFCARAYGIPTVIARMNTSYGPNGGLPFRQLEQLLAGERLRIRSDPMPYSPIAQDDINEQTVALLDAAGVEPLIVNWAGDEVVTVQRWVRELAGLAEVGVEIETVPILGTQCGLVADVERRRSITGPCAVTWDAGLRAAYAARYVHTS